MKIPAIKQLTLGGATVLGMIGFASPAAFAMSGGNYTSSSHYSSYKTHKTNHHHCNTRHIKYMKYSQIRYTSYDKYHKHTPICLHHTRYEYN